MQAERHSRCLALQTPLLLLHVTQIVSARACTCGHAEPTRAIVRDADSGECASCWVVVCVRARACRKGRTLENNLLGECSSSSFSSSAPLPLSLPPFCLFLLLVLHFFFPPLPPAPSFLLPPPPLSPHPRAALPTPPSHLFFIPSFLLLHFLCPPL